MNDCFASYYDYCRSSIVSGQRWVREKIYDPALSSRDPSYHCYHAEPFDGQEGSCWERREMEREMVRTTAYAASRENIQKLELEANLTLWAFLRKEGNEEQASSPSAMSRIQKTAEGRTQELGNALKSVYSPRPESGLCIRTNLYQFAPGQTALAE